ncbi:hypothetical protein ACJX0J_000069 [Zea mays]
MEKKRNRDREQAILQGDSEIAEAWFDQAAEYWKQAIALTPGNYIEAQNWLKITKRFEFDKTTLHFHKKGGLLSWNFESNQKIYIMLTQGKQLAGLFDLMIIRSSEPEVKIAEWARPGHTGDLEEISRKWHVLPRARFSNYEAWLSDPTHIGPSAQVVWPIVGQEILNGDVGGIWRASGITSELQLYCTAIGALIFASLMLFAGCFRGGLDPITGGLWLSDIAHHHLAIAILFLIAGHMYRTNWGIGHGLKDILEAHKGPFTGQGHKGLYEILTTSWHLCIGSTTIVVAHHMYSMPPYSIPSLATDYGTQLSLFTHHMWIGGFLIVGAAAHSAIFMVRDYDPTTRYNDLLDRVLRHRDAIISHLNWVCIFLGFHSFGLYIHNDTMSALGRPQDMFSDTAIQLQPIFAQWIQNIHAGAPGVTAPGATTSTSLTWGGGELVAIGGKVALLPIPLGTADFLVHHIHAFTIHVTVLILLKGVLFARSSRLIPDKANLGFRFPCDGPGRGGTCQVSAWDHVFLGLFWMYNSISVVIFHFSWKMQSDVWGTISDQGIVTHITGGNFAQSSITINGWLRDFLWAQASQVIQSYGSSLSAYGLFFLGAHFVWAFSLMFLFSGRGYWQELIESIVWAHNKLKVAPATQPRALSIIQGRAVGVTHYLLGGIATTWAFFLARIIAVG